MCHRRSDRSQFVNRSAQEHLMCPEPKLDWCVMIVMDHAAFAIANFRQTSLRLHVNQRFWAPLFDSLVHGIHDLCFPKTHAWF